ncbi:MAG: hydantoinase B/oxoprolinase family protein [Rhizobiales bacterium]|nr:hydantoinase B/oxoprolinase family protein [Hyphomicrobiales bacterium]
MTAPSAGDADPTQSMQLSGTSGRMRHPSKGLLRGRPGMLAAIEIEGKALEATASPAALVERGERLRLLLPGGGGYGNPSDRDPSLIERDLRDGYISRDGARRDYGYRK